VKMKAEAANSKRRIQEGHQIATRVPEETYADMLLLATYNERAVAAETRVAIQHWVASQHVRLQRLREEE